MQPDVSLEFQRNSSRPWINCLLRKAASATEPEKERIDPVSRCRGETWGNAQANNGGNCGERNARSPVSQGLSMSRGDTIRTCDLYVPNVAL